MKRVKKKQASIPESLQKDIETIKSDLKALKIDIGLEKLGLGLDLRMLQREIERSREETKQFRNDTFEKEEREILAYRQANHSERIENLETSVFGKPPE